MAESQTAARIRFRWKSDPWQIEQMSRGLVRTKPLCHRHSNVTIDVNRRLVVADSSSRALLLECSPFLCCIKGSMESFIRGWFCKSFVDRGLIQKNGEVDFGMKYERSDCIVYLNLRLIFHYTIFKHLNVLRTRHLVANRSLATSLTITKQIELARYLIRP